NAGGEEEPVREHVHEARGHVTRSDLEGNQEVAERTTQSRRQHEEYHDRTVHGDEGEIEFGVKFAVFSDPASQNRAKPAHVHIREAELQAEDHRQDTAKEGPQHTCDEVLLCNYFMVFAEDVFCPEIAG